MAALTAGPFTDPMGITDNVAATDAKHLPKEAVGPGDVVAPKLAIIRIFTETMATADNPTETKIANAPTFQQTPLEVVGISELGSKTDTIDTYVDVMAITEIATPIVNKILTFSDPMGITDGFSVRANLTLTFTEQMTVLDNQRFTFNTSVSRISTDVMAISESVITTLTSTIPPVNYSNTSTEVMGIGENFQVLINVDPLHSVSSTSVLVGTDWKQTSWALKQSGIWLYPLVWLYKDGAWVQIQ